MDPAGTSVDDNANGNSPVQSNSSEYYDDGKSARTDPERVEIYRSVKNEQEQSKRKN